MGQQATIERGVRSEAIQAALQLRKVPPGGAPSLIFEALRCLAPVAGGLIGVMGTEMSGATISHVVRLPAEVLEGWTRTPLPLLMKMMAPLVPASPGDLISDRAAITGPLREEIELFRVMRGAGLGESAGYKVAARPAASGRVEHRYLTIALEAGAAFLPWQADVLRALQPEMEAALARLEVPLITSEPVLTQIIDQGELGFVCLSQTGQIIELNARGQELCFRYLREAHVGPERGWLVRFVDRMRAETTSAPCRLVSLERGTVLEVDATVISKGIHGLSAPATLLRLRESDLLSPKALRALAELSPKRREVANLLARTALSQKQIAAKLNVSLGTARKHITEVFAALEVKSREELMLKLLM